MIAAPSTMAAVPRPTFENLGGAKRPDPDILAPLHESESESRSSEKGWSLWGMGKRSYPGTKRNDVATKRAAERTTDAVQVVRDSRGPKTRCVSTDRLDANRVLAAPLISINVVRVQADHFDRTLPPGRTKPRFLQV